LSDGWSSLSTMVYESDAIVDNGEVEHRRRSEPPLEARVRPIYQIEGWAGLIRFVQGIQKRARGISIEPIDDGNWVKTPDLSER
jgi:hypothetical protein